MTQCKDSTWMSYKKYVDTDIDLKMFLKEQFINTTHNKFSAFNIVKSNTISKILEKILSGHETD